MEKVLILNSSEKDKTLRALKAAAAKARGKARTTLEGLTQALSTNPTAGRARRSKETSSMAKRRSAKRATPRKTTTPRRRRRIRTNPTTAAPARRAPSRRRRTSGVATRLKSVNIMGIVIRGASIAGGFLAQSFISRQSERLLPSLPRMVHGLIGSATVAGASLMLAGGKPWAEDIAAAAVAGGIQGLAHEFMPGVFSGLHEGDVYVQGYEDGAQGYSDAINGVEPYDYSGDVNGLGGLAFNGRRIPDDIATRPANF